MSLVSVHVNNVLQVNTQMYKVVIIVRNHHLDIQPLLIEQPLHLASPERLQMSKVYLPAKTVFLDKHKVFKLPSIVFHVLKDTVLLFLQILIFTAMPAPKDVSLTSPVSVNVKNALMVNTKTYKG